MNSNNRLSNSSEITIMETGLRDGLQVVEKYVSIEDRLLIVNGLIDAGIKHIQVTSFVNPKKVPQMSESEKLVKRLSSNKNVEYSALVFNLKGVERALNSGINKIETSISVSESYNQKNLGLNNIQAVENLKKVIQFGLENKLNIRAGLQCVWGCPYDRSVNQDIIINNISTILNFFEILILFFISGIGSLPVSPALPANIEMITLVCLLMQSKIFLVCLAL